MGTGLEKRIFSPATDSAWRQWRRAGVGGSDIVIIRHKSPHRTRTQLLTEKVAKKEIQLSDFIMKKAADQEYVARHVINKFYHCNVEPLCLHASGNERHKVSLDGYDLEKRILMEHKCTSLAILNSISFSTIYSLQDHRENPIAAWLEQMVWQMGILNRDYVKRAFLTVSTLTSTEKPKVIELQLKWEEVRRIYKQQQAAASLFLREWDEISKHQAKNKGANKC